MGSILLNFCSVFTKLSFDCDAAVLLQKPGLRLRGKGSGTASRLSDGLSAVLWDPQAGEGGPDTHVTFPNPHCPVMGVRPGLALNSGFQNFPRPLSGLRFAVGVTWEGQNNRETETKWAAPV